MSRQGKRRPSCLLGLAFKVNVSVHGPECGTGSCWGQGGPALLGLGRPACACRGALTYPCRPLSPSVSRREVRPSKHTRGRAALCRQVKGRLRALASPLCSGHQPGGLFVLSPWASAPVPTGRGAGPSWERPEGVGDWWRRTGGHVSPPVSPPPPPWSDSCQAMSLPGPRGGPGWEDAESMV